MNRRSILAIVLLLAFVAVVAAPHARASAPASAPQETGNSDGYADVVVGVPGEDWTVSPDTLLDVGVVHVLYAEESGVPDQTGDLWRQGANGIYETMEADDRFGAALAAGDFNGDDHTDLAVGVPGQTVGGDVSAGAVHVIYASPTGLTATGNTIITQDDLSHVSDPYDYFGQELAAGDFDGDGYDDLAVGIPMENVYLNGFNAEDGGAVEVIYGDADGLGDSYWEIITEVDLGTQHETGDQFGYALAVCDFNADGYDDLAVGVPFEDFVTVEDVGSVQIIFGSADRLDGNDDSQVIFQGQNGMTSGGAEEGDLFGQSLAAGYFNGDDYCDLAVGVPGEEVGTTYTDMGAVHALYASASTTFSPVGSDWQWTRNDVDMAGGPPQDYANFGRVLAAGDFDGSGTDDLAIGTPYDDVGGDADAGSVHVMYGGMTNGLSDWGDRVWYQGSYCNTAVEPNDRFGWSLAAGDVDNDGYDDLVIGTPYEHVGAVGDAGMVQVFYGDSPGIPSTPRYQNFHQDRDYIQNSVESGDEFGLAVAVLHVTPHLVYLPLVIRE